MFQLSTPLMKNLQKGRKSDLSLSWGTFASQLSTKLSGCTVVLTKVGGMKQTRDFKFTKPNQETFKLNGLSPFRKNILFYFFRSFISINMFAYFYSRDTYTYPNK